MIFPKRVSIHGCGLVLAAVLLLAPDRAQARDECGTWSASATSHTCPDRAYGSGIRYDAGDGWINGNAGDVTVTVTGTVTGIAVATTITSPTTAGGNWASGIVVRTATQAGSGATTATRNVALTVGTGTNVVEIAQSTNSLTGDFNNNGVAIHQRGRGADSTTVTLGSGVRIGGPSSSAAMKNQGVHVLVENGGNSGTHTIDSAATIYSSNFGLLMDNRGSGNSAVTNSGSITVYSRGGDATRKSGIRILDWSHDPSGSPPSYGGDGRTADTTTTVTNSGSIAVFARNAHGIHVDADGLGLYETVNSGTISVVPGIGGHGIYVEKTEGAGSGDVTVTNSGTITAEDRGDPARGTTGIRVRARGSGTYKIVHSGTIGGGGFGHGLYVRAGDHTGAAGTDAVVIESSGDIATQSSAIYVTHYGDNGYTRATSGNIRIVTTGGEIVSGASNHVGAIHVLEASAGGGLAIANEARVTVSGEDGVGLAIVTSRRTSGPVSIANEGAVTAEAYGIHLRYAGPGAATIDNSGTVTTKDHAVYVQWSVGQRLETEGFDKTVTNAGTLTSSEADGIRVEQVGGSATVTTSGTVTAAKNGIWIGGGNTAVVTIAAGATVTAGEAGVYTHVAGAGLRIARKYTPGYVQGGQDGEALPDGEAIVTLDDHLNQVVRVDGTVTGGTDAAVHLDGGGALIVGRTGKLVAGAGRPAVLVNDPGPAIIYVDGEVTGSEGADAAVHLTGGGSVTVGLDGRVQAGGAALAVRSDRPEGDDPAATVIVVHVEGGRVAPFTQESVGAALERVGPIGGTGVEDGVTAFAVETTTENGQQRSTGYTRPLSLDDDGKLIVPPGLPSEPPESFPPESFQCALAEDERCRLYEALPAALLAMTGLPSREERMSAARDGTGGWARIEAASGTWKAGRATQAGLRVDHSRFGVRAGVDVAAGEDARLGVSAHGLRGTAKTADTVKAKLSGVGFGLHAAAALDGGFQVDAQAAATWFDVDLDTPDASRDDVKGRGYAASLELGRRMALPDGVTVTPRAGFAWSDAGLGRFQEVTKHDDRARAEVDVTDASSLTGRVGVGLESTTPDGARLFGSLDLAHEFSGKRETAVSGTALKSSAKKTSLRLGIGGLFDLGDGASLGGSATYALGSGSTFGGALSLDVQF